MTEAARKEEKPGVEMDFWRQFDIIRPNEDLAFSITMIGAGGIGSPTVLALCKMGCRDVTVFDDDQVETHNLPNQIYRLEDVGIAKVHSLAEAVSDFTGVDINGFIKRVDEKTTLEGVVISGVDTMEARHAIWKAVKYKARIPLYIDARMGAEVCRIYTIRPTNPDDVAFYEKTLYTDGEAQELPCTGRAIIYNVFMIAALIANQVKKFGRGEAMNREVIFDLATLTVLLQ